MSEISIKIDDMPSRSKGWGRYAVSQGARRIIQSNTGNEWVSSNKATEADAGSEITLRLQVMLRIGKTGRQETTSASHRLVVEDGASCKIELVPGSQGIRVTVTGAREVTP